MTARFTVAILPLLIALQTALQPLPVQAATREQAIAQALRADGNRGRVLEVRRASSGGGEVYLIKTLTDGRVRVHRIPADP